MVCETLPYSPLTSIEIPKDIEFCKLYNWSWMDLTGCGLVLCF